MKKQTNEENPYIRIDIPAGILSFLEQKSRISKSQKTKTYSVTEIIGCLRKPFYQKLDSKKLVGQYEIVENMWPTVRGKLLHEMSKAYKWNELDIEFDILLGEGRVGTVSGRLDMYDWKTRTIIDLKTTKDVYSQAENNTIPKDDHILQIQCYGTIFSNIIPIENLVLLYADLNDMIAFRVPSQDKTWWLKERILELEKSISEKKPPTREISKACNFCKYKNMCKPYESNDFIFKNNKIFSRKIDRGRS